MRKPWWYALLAVAALTVLALVSWKWNGEAPAFIKTPDQNVLIVTIDTLRADALGSYGGRAHTPNLDAIAAEGVRFTFAHAHAVVTLPSHASILTGRYPFEHGVRDNAGFRLNESALTLAEMARAKGLATGAFVGAFPLDRRFGLAQGFDTYDDLGGRQIEQADFAFAERRAEEVVRAATDWIGQQQKPWLVWVHVFDPHSPYAPPAPFDGRFPGDPYAGEVAYVDHALAPLLETVRRAPRPTTVVVTADHGEGLGDHGEQSHGLFAYESTLRVPLLLAQVKGVSASGSGASGPAMPGTTSQVPVRHIDIVPTIADLLGLETGGLQGRTLLAALHEDPEPRPSYFEAMTGMLTRGWAPLKGVIVDREKYIELPEEELYDLNKDPGEANNLAGSARKRVAELTARLTEFDAKLPVEQKPEDPEARTRLQSLGYVASSAPRKAQYGPDDDPKRLIEIENLMDQGIDLLYAGRHAEAVAAFERVIERRPDMGLAYRRLAFIHWQTGASSLAIATLQAALRRNGPDVEIETRLGTYLAETGKIAAALPMLEKVVRAAPEHADAANALGIAYARAGRNADALKTFERVVTLDPRDVQALENIGNVHLQRGDLAAAGKAFSSAVDKDPRSSRAQAGLGVVAIKSGRQQEALDRWRRATELDRTNFDALFNLASELVHAGRQDEARPYLEQFVRTAPRGRYLPEIQRFQRLLQP